MTESADDLELAIRSACDAGDFDGAATRAMEGYGPEILSFLVARLRAVSDGEEAFSMFAEDLWRGLPQFGFRCSVRAWLYTLARNAANRYAVAPANRAAKRAALPSELAVSALIERERAATEAHLRTDVKDKMRALRESLPVEDQTLLVLHVDRRLPWRDLARVMSEAAESLEGDALNREAARLRKRFERVKTELRSLAVSAGLIES